MKLHAVELSSINLEIFHLFSRQPPLLTAGDREACNTMTIGWCQLGTLWSCPVCTVYVRPERYTYRFMESHNYFTVSILPEDLNQITKICGTRSGRDFDKIRECGLTLEYGMGQAPFFREAECVLVCKKIYTQDMEPQFVKDDAAILPFYESQGGWHRMYVGQVVEAYLKS